MVDEPAELELGDGYEGARFERERLGVAGWTAEGKGRPTLLVGLGGHGGLASVLGSGEAKEGRDRDAGQGRTKGSRSVAPPLRHRCARPFIQPTPDRPASRPDDDDPTDRRLDLSTHASQHTTLPMSPSDDDDDVGPSPWATSPTAADDALSVDDDGAASPASAYDDEDEDVFEDTSAEPLADVPSAGLPAAAVEAEVEVEPPLEAFPPATVDEPPEEDAFADGSFDAAPPAASPPAFPSPTAAENDDDDFADFDAPASFGAAADGGDNDDFGDFGDFDEGEAQAAGRAFDEMDLAVEDDELLAPPPVPPAAAAPALVRPLVCLRRVRVRVESSERADSPDPTALAARPPADAHARPPARPSRARLPDPAPPPAAARPRPRPRRRADGRRGARRAWARAGARPALFVRPSPPLPPSLLSLPSSSRADPHAHPAELPGESSTTA